MINISDDFNTPVNLGDIIMWRGKRGFVRGKVDKIVLTLNYKGDPVQRFSVQVNKEDNPKIVRYWGYRTAVRRFVKV